MKQVASLRYGVIFKKAFGQVDVFKAFVKDIIGIDLEIDKVETEKEFSQTIGSVKVKFDCYAEDSKNRVIVEIQHRNDSDHYDRFLHYHCVTLLEQIASADNYRPELTVYTIVVLTSGDKHKTDVAVIDFDPKDKYGKGLNEIRHKVIYLAAKYVDDNTPEPYREWLKIINESLNQQIDEANYPRPELQKIIAAIAKNLISPEEKYWMIEEYNDEAAKRKNFEEGIEAGIEKGQLQEKQMIARNLLAMGLNSEAIEQATGLTAVDIKNLQSEE